MDLGLWEHDFLLRLGAYRDVLVMKVLLVNFLVAEKGCRIHGEASGVCY